MRIRPLALSPLLGIASYAFAVSPNDFGNCLVQWGGSVRTYRTVCADGSTCDLDGLVDGRCTFDAAPCFDAPPGTFICHREDVETSATATSSDAGAAANVQAALDALLAAGGAEPRCRSALVTVPIDHRRGRNHPVEVRVSAQTAVPFATADSTVDLYCLTPGGPSFADVVAPILTARCAVNGCHAVGGRGGIDLSSPRAAYDGLLGASKIRPDRPRLASLPFTIRRRMPLGCYDRHSPRPSGGCLTRAERRAVTQWVRAGGADD